MSDRIKLYAVSAFGLIVEPDPENPDRDRVTPVIYQDVVQATDIERVEEQVRGFSEKIFPPTESWTVRIIGITRIDPSHYQTIVDLHRLHALADETEPFEEDIAFSLDDARTIPARVLSETDKPAS